MDPRRSAALDTPLPMSQSRIAQLGQYLEWQPEQQRMPTWAGSVARVRECFQDTILVVKGDEGVCSYYLFVYAVITPTYLALAPVTYVLQPRVQGPIGWHNIEEVASRRHRFHVNFAALASGEELEGVDIAKVSVIDCVSFQGGMEAFSPSDPEPLAEFLAHCAALDLNEELEQDSKRRRKKDE
eukprot:2832520-Lingulodinium_polyedra.AAC.1